MTPITIEVFGDPKAQPRARSFILRGKGGRVIMGSNGQPILRVHEAGTAEAWKQAVALAAQPFVPMPPLAGPLRVDVEFRFPRPKAHFNSKGQLKSNAPYWHLGRVDLDNLWKAVTDCLTSIGMWVDDGVVAEGYTVKRYAMPGLIVERPGACIQISDLEPLHQSANATMTALQRLK